MQISRNLMLPVAAVLSSVLFAPMLSAAHAAQITAPARHLKAWEADMERTNANWPTDPVLCDLVLEGQVEEGDAASLEQKFQSIVSNANAFTFFLCLRSSGGDLREAIKIAQFILRIQRPSIATVVEDGQTCASACAVIFLAGNAPARVGAWPLRFLHPRGRLLYHSSRLDLGKYSEQELLAVLTAPTADPRGLKGKIVDLYTDGLRDVQSLITTFQPFAFQREDLSDRWVRPSLFLEMFAQDPDEWICVDSVDAVGRWNIQVYGYEPPRPLRKEHYFNLCRNTYNWRLDRFASDLEVDLEEPGEPKKPRPNEAIGGRKGDFDDRITVAVQATYRPLTCVIELKYGETPAGEKKRQLDAESTITAYFAGGESVAISQLAPVALYPPATLLRDLPGVRSAPAGAARGPDTAFTAYGNTVMNGCSYRSIPKLEREACQSRCAADRACVAYSHNKITKSCELKHTLTALRQDARWNSGAPSTGPVPGRSIRTHVMTQFSFKDRLEGTLIDEAPEQTEGSCSQRCLSDPACVAVELGASGRICRRFSELTGLRQASGDQEIFEITIKKQQ